MDKKLEEGNQPLADSQPKENGTNEHSLEEKSTLSSHEKLVKEMEPKNNETVKQVEEPAQPIATPEKLTEQPAQPAVTPETPTEQPVQPTVTPERPTEQPAQPAVPKDTVAQQPKQQTTAPKQTIQQPNPSKQKEGKQDNPTTNGKAITGFILGITGLTVPYLGFLTAIVGIVFSSISLKELKNTQQAGKGLAIAGLVLGIISVSLYVIVIFFLMFIFMIDSSY